MSRNRSKSAPSRSSSSKTKKSESHIRIIGGEWRSRKLSVLDADGLRPTGDRIRETLFNWLTPWLPKARCLDLFAGSGALGLEALSRGANFSHFIETQPKAAERLKQNLALLNVSSADASLETVDALSLLSAQPETTFDIVFMDPPFAANYWNPCIEKLNRNGWLSEQALIYIEAPKSTQLEAPPNWSLHREKASGDVHARLYKTFAE